MSSAIMMPNSFELSIKTMMEDAVTQAVVSLAEKHGFDEEEALRAELRAARPRLLERIEADDEESTDEGTPAMAPDGSPSPRTARREGARVPTGAKRLKGE